VQPAGHRHFGAVDASVADRGDRSHDVLPDRDLLGGYRVDVERHAEVAVLKARASLRG
jgi:hypothetical protein